MPICDKIRVPAGPYTNNFGARAVRLFVGTHDFRECAINDAIIWIMYEESKIDFFFESLMNWAITGRVCEDLYFAVRHYFFCILSALNCRWLPFIRQAEKQLKQYDKHLRPQYTRVERLGLGLFWSALMFIIPVLIAIIITSTLDLPLLISIDPQTPTASTSILAGYLKTVATVLATLTALLLAVIALTIQVKTSNLAGADFLLNAMIRRRGFLPIAAFLFGTVFTALLGVVLSSRLHVLTLNDYTAVTAFLSFFSLLFLLNLLRRTMQTLGSSELEQLLADELASSLRTSFRNTLKQTLFETHFSAKLEQLGFMRYPTSEKTELHSTEYNLKRLGKIIAIDPAPLSRISKILQLTPLPHGTNKPAPVWGHSYQGDAPCVTVQRNGHVTKYTQLALLTNEEAPSKQITRLIRKAFIIQKHSDSELPWQGVRQLIYDAIANYESTTIKAVANALENILDDYLETQLVVAGQGRLLLEDFTGDIVYGFKPPHPSNLRLSDLASYAARKLSQDCLDELLNCIYILVRTAFEKQNEKYFRDWMFEFYWAYHSFGPYAKDQDLNIAPDVTRRIHWLSDMLRMYLYNYEKSVEQVQKVSPYAISYLSLCLRILKTSAERYDQLTFDAVTEHVMQFLKNELNDTKGRLDIYRGSNQLSIPTVTNRSDENEQELLLAYDQIYDYKNLVYVIAGAWLMHKVKAKVLQAENLGHFLQTLIDKTGDFRSLLDLYAMPGMADIISSHDNPFGFDNWDWPYSPYSKARSGTEFQRWISPFYKFLLLKKVKTNSSKIKLRNLRQTNMASHESLKKFLSETTAVEYNLPMEYQDRAWSMESKELERAKKQINRILAYWKNEKNLTSPG